MFTGGKNKRGVVATHVRSKRPSQNRSQNGREKTKKERRVEYGSEDDEEIFSREEELNGERMNAFF